MAAASQRQRTRRQPPRRARGPLVFGAVALVLMLALAAWAVRGLLRTESPPATSPVATSEAGTLPVVTPTTSPAEATATVPAEAGTPGPTATPTPTPTPPAPVVVGAFGELPAPNLPQAAFPPGQLDLIFEPAFDLATLPSEAPVYRLVPPDWNEERVAELARELGIDGTLQSTATGSFVVRGPAGQLVVTGFTVQYQAAEPAVAPTPVTTPKETPEPTPEASSLLSDAIAIEAARSWLQRHQLVSTPLDAGTVRERIPEQGLVIVTFGPAEPSPVLSAVPGATLAVAADGSIRQAFVAWPASMESSTYSLRPADALWQDVVNRRGTVEIDESVLRQANLPLQGTAKITKAELAWVDAGQGMTRYLTPVVRFRGTATFAGYPEPVPVTVTVAAVAAQVAPRG
ncbi:hypothetical protein OO015_05835 [Thermomicrobium sp. 4228-Ro]|uniref:hypothetical protein n=1 Tax=Thermomicrobium sp. 4228-Ro TaxID=2993937 RepID=UPI00224935BE|nr:hypothetical protein [Thermomicrobium sp. 4228-Ro]MCX2727016.1 hypothetical protein [Thermomicrobium sp. 4228-Ro]